MPKPLDYKSSGVDVAAGDALVDWLVRENHPDQKPQPHHERIVSGIGGFASLFRIQFPQMKKPCLAVEKQIFDALWEESIE